MLSLAVPGHQILLKSIQLRNLKCSHGSICRKGKAPVWSFNNSVLCHCSADVDKVKKLWHGLLFQHLLVGHEKPKPPEFVSKMQVAEPLLEGRPFHIECPVSAQPPATITWHKDGQPLQNQPRCRTLFLKGVASLDVDAATPKDSGVYECVATNPLGKASSSVEIVIPGNHYVPFIHSLKPR